MYPAEWSGLKKLLMLKAASGGGSAPQTETLSGSLVTFETTKARPLTQCRVDFLPKQEGSGNPSPENVRPISGWDGLSVFVSPTTSGGTEYPVSWQSAGTVYGGYVDLVRGVLVVTHGTKVFDGDSAVSWERISANNGFRVSVTEMGTVTTTMSQTDDYLCDSFPKSGTTCVQFGTSSGNDKVFFKELANFLADITVASWNAWLAQHPVKIYFALATPITYSLTPQQITTLIGTNNIWSDAGDVTVTYVV